MTASAVPQSSRPSRPSRNVDLLNGPVGPSLIRMAIPMAIAMLAIMLQSLADTWFIGMLGTEQLAAISFTFPVTFLVMALSMGMGIGLSAVVAPALGRKDHNAAARITSDALLLAVVLVALLSVVGYLSIDPVFNLLGASDSQLLLIREYMAIWYIGVAFIVIPMVGNSALRAGGNTKGPSQIMMTAAVVNFILDPLLIFGIGPFPEWGIAGAAWASLLSLFSTLLAALWMLGKQEKLLSLRGCCPESLLSHWRQVTVIGVPAALSQMLTPISAAVLTRMASDYGSPAVAALGVGTRIEPLAMMLTMSLASCLPAFVGQNRGANQPQRIIEGVKFAQMHSVKVQGIIWLVLLLASSLIASAFSDNPDVVEGIRWYLVLVPLGYFALGWAAIATNTFNALLKPGQAFATNVLRLLVFGLPLAWIGGQLWGVYGMFGGMALGNILAGIASMVWVKRTVGELIALPSEPTTEPA